MDMTNLLRSIEALLFEVVSWLAFYPVTFWRCVRHPINMMNYAEKQLQEPTETQFNDALAPPLFLFLTVFVAHLVELRSGPSTFAGLLQDDRNLLLFRAALFSLFPLAAAIQRVRQLGVPLTRASLRPAFYSQCYLAAPFVLLLDLGGILAQFGSSYMAAAILLNVIGAVWYLAGLSVWFSYHHQDGLLRGFFRALMTFGAAAAILLAIAASIALGGGVQSTP